MALSRVVRVGDGSTKQFTVDFALGYISESDVTCRVGDEVDGSNDPIYRTITFLSETLVEISGDAPGVGVNVVFDRTVDKEDLVVDFSNGDILDEDNLDAVLEQIMMAVHEVLDGRFGTFDADLDMGGFTIKNLADPVEDADAAPKSYVDDRLSGIDGSVSAAAASAVAAASSAADAQSSEDDAEVSETSAAAYAAAAAASALEAASHVSGLKWKPSARAASTGNLTLSGEQTVDGIALSSGDRVLAKDQTSSEENGMYVVDTGAWARDTAMDTWSELVSAVVATEEGTVHADTIWMCTVNEGGTLDTDALTFISILGQVSGTNVSIVPAGMTNVTATDVQNAIDDLDAALEAIQANVTLILSGIAVDGSGNVTIDKNLTVNGN